jgi:hypothetical protein
MKIILTAIAVYIFFVGFLYLAFSFGNWTFNAGKWEPFSRVLCALIGVIIFILGIGLTIRKIEDDY